MSDPPPTQALERAELAQRREATRRSIQRNASQARGELERGNPREVLRITGLMLRGRDLRTMTEPQVPLVYYRGRAFEELGNREAALACYRALAAWDGGAHPVVDDARAYIDRGLEQLLALLGEPPPPGQAPRVVPPERDRRVFPAPVLTVARIVIAVGLTTLMTVVALILLAIFS